MLEQEKHGHVDMHVDVGVPLKRFKSESVLDTSSHGSEHKILPAQTPNIMGKNTRAE